MTPPHSASTPPPAFAPISRFFPLIAYSLFLTQVAFIVHNELTHMEYRIIDKFKVGHFRVNYIDDGFTRRGLIGTLLRPIYQHLEPTAREEIMLVGLFGAAVGTICIALLVQCTKPDWLGDITGSTILRLALLTSPTGIMQLAFQVGRLDYVLPILCAIAAALYTRGTFGWVLITVSLAIATHECALFFGLPILFVFMYMYRKSGNPYNAQSARELTILCAFVALLAVLFAIYGSKEGLAVTEFMMQESVSEHNFWSRPILQANLTLYTIEYFVLAFYALAPYAYLTILYTRNGIPLDIPFLASFSPLALFFLGVDYARWTGLVFLTVVAITTINVRWRNLDMCVLRSPVEKIVLVLYLLPLGPLGSIAPFANALG